MSACAGTALFTPKAKPDQKRIEETINQSKGCEWSIFIGLSDLSLKALREAQNNPSNTAEETALIKKDRQTIALQDQNWLDNCYEEPEEK